VKLKKVAYPSSFTYFSILSIHEVVGEAILLNNFLKQLRFIYKVVYEVFFKKITVLVKPNCAKQGIYFLKIFF
jgi:hypothetical protein